MHLWPSVWGFVAAMVATVPTATVQAESPLRISIAAVRGLTAVLVFENSSSEALDLTVSASLLLGQEEPLAYWAPLDAMTGAPYDGAVRIDPGKPMPPALPRPRLRLQPGQVRRVTVDMKNLRWAKRISSVWPDQELEALVPAGGYKLVLEVEGEKPGAQWRSQAVSVQVGR